jgi:UDP-glucose 4-epimerase
VSLVELVRLLLEVAGGGSFTLVPFPEERKRIDIGDFYADISRAQATLGWAPLTGLREGLQQTVDYYRRHKQQYL